MTGARQIDPRFRIGLLLAVALGVLALSKWWQVGAVVVGLFLLGFVVRLPVKRTLRAVVKLWGFALFVLASYALTRESPEVDRWVHLYGLGINLGGVLVGATMMLRVVAVVLASHVARAGDPRAVAAGLAKLKAPPAFAVPVDAVLALLGGDAESGGGRGGGGRGRGDGGGGGRNRGAADESAAQPKEGFWASVKRMGRGDVGPIVQRLERQIARAQAHVGGERDVAVIAGTVLTMLGIRALKILPSIPFAPGHKLVLLTPLYILASAMTKTRFGGTLTGLVMGTVAFLLGDGKYGIFEILKHVAPGVLCDLFVPLLLRRNLGGIGWSLFGAFVAAGRFVTILCVVAVVQAPRIAYAMLGPGLLIHCTFGAASGYVTYHLIRSAKDTWANLSPETGVPTSSLSSCGNLSSTKT